MADLPIEDEIHYCQVHPTVETELRCNKCERYMCVKCAVQTPVGYRCRECVRQHDDKFFNAAALDPLLVFVVAVAGMFAGGFLLNYFPTDFMLFASVVLGFVFGAFLSEGIIRAIKKRKGRHNWKYALVGVAIGAILGGVIASAVDYPAEYGDAQPFIRQLEKSDPVGAQAFSELYPSETDYILQNTLSLGMIIFVTLSGYAVYLRMKP